MANKFIKKNFFWLPLLQVVISMISFSPEHLQIPKNEYYSLLMHSRHLL